MPTVCGPTLNDGQLHSIVAEIKHVITESSCRKGELKEREKLEDFDAEEAELLSEERELEEQVVRNVGDILITLIKTFKTAFLPFLDELSSYLMPMMGKNKTVAERSTCFHIFDQVAENCGEAALKYYPIYLPFLLGSSDDQNPVVRQNALYGLGFCVAHGGSVFKPFVGEAFSRISVVITHLNAREPGNLWPYYNGVYALCKICQFHRESIDSAQAEAASAVEIFCQFENPETLVPHLDEILNKLVALPQIDNPLVQDRALIALGVVASLCEEHFKNYYDFVMPYLKTTLLNASDKSDHILQSKALMCISFVGMAVGKEKFKDDLKQVMEVLKSLQESQVKEFYTFAGILQAWCRICGCIGKEFLSYMSIVMPPLLEYAQLEPDKTVPLELDDSTHRVKFWDETISISGRGLLTLKTLACNALDIFAGELEEDFYPWISQAASILVPLLKFYFDDDVRDTACSGA